MLYGFVAVYPLALCYNIIPCIVLYYSSPICIILCIAIFISAIFVVAWLVFHTSQSHDINKSLASNETVRKSNMDSMYGS